MMMMMMLMSIFIQKPRLKMMLSAAVDPLKQLPYYEEY